MQYLLPLLSISIISPFATPAMALGPKPIALITGGTRGIGSGIARVLAEDGYDLLLTYNTDKETADEFAKSLADDIGSKLRVKCVGGDISLSSTRDEIFKALDSMTDDGGDGCNGRLAVMVHNAGQYVGMTSENSDGIQAKALSFGDGSLLDEEGRTDFDTMHYYQRMYGEAFVDLCERSLLRMGSSEDEDGGGGSIIGISSPGVNAHYYGPDWSYSMPGSGKCLMEYSSRIYASKVAARGINVNVIVPGVTKTEAWGRVAKIRGLEDGWEEGIVQKRVPMKRMITPRDIGNTVKFLCSESGKLLTGIVIPVDGGRHMTH